MRAFCSRLGWKFGENGFANRAIDGIGVHPENRQKRLIGVHPGSEHSE